MDETAPRSQTDEVAWELHKRQRLAVLALAGGFLYELSSLTLRAVLGGVPSVGVLQGITPALHGVANPAISPHYAELRFISHHAFGTIAGSVLASISIVFAVIVLRFLYQAARYRRPEAMPAAGPLMFYGGLAFALLTVLSKVVQAIEAHNFITGHNFTNAAADHAFSTNSANVIVAYVDIVVALCFAVGVVIVVLNAMRVGLLTRLLGYVGFFVGVLFLLPLPFEIVTALWLVAVGILLLGRWPGGDPPAWAAGEARPWPSAADQRAAREAAGNGRPARGGRARAGAAKPVAATAAIEAPPEPTAPVHSSSKKRKRKRGGPRR